MGPELRQFPYEKSNQSTAVAVKTLMQRKIKEDRSSLINAGMNNLSLLVAPNQQGDTASNAYKQLETRFKVAPRSVAVSPSASQGKLVLPTSDKANGERMGSVKPSDKFKYQERIDKEQKDKEMMAFMRDMNRQDAQESLDQFTLKFHFKKPSTTNLDPKIAAQAQKAALAAYEASKESPNVSAMLAQQQNFSLNLKDFGDQEVFEMQNIVDFILRKVSDCILYMQVMNKNVFASATSHR